MTYTFKEKELTLINPKITITGDFGGYFKSGKMQKHFFMDVLFETADLKFLYRLESDILPVDSTPKSFSNWVENELKKYENEN
jgi:hypothetical protein